MWAAAYIIPTFVCVAAGFSDPLVQLPYGTFMGKYSAAYNISYFRSIPFSAPPVGRNRFRAPQPVEHIAGVYDSDVPFPMCPQRTNNGSEDCLYLSLYSRPWAPSDALRPVMIFFYGGAFIQGDANLSVPPSTYPVLNVSTHENYVAVYSNYRTNAFGFLPGKAVKNDAESDLNPGLLDQQAALLWINKNIAAFGGDASNVTIWGQSAGGGSVVAQVIANGGQTTPKLFSKAIASSPFWPRNYRYDAPESEAIYSTLTSLVGCSTAADSLACLKAAPVQSFLDANAVIESEHTYTTSSYTWAPVIDDGFLREPLSVATAAGRVNADLVMSMYNRFEGSTFVTSALNQPASTGSNGTAAFNSTEQGFQFYVNGFLPNLSKATFKILEALYPPASASTEYTTQQDRAGFIYRDVVLSCPAYWIATAARRSGWVGEYTISPAKHASDVGYWNTVNSLQTTQPLVYKGFAGAFGSFIETGDPNTFKLTNTSQSGVPKTTSGNTWVVEASGFVVESAGGLATRCNFWRSHDREVPI